MLDLKSEVPPTEVAADSEPAEVEGETLGVARSDSQDGDFAELESWRSGSDEGISDLDDPSFYFNRELSWLEFNHRVLEEARDERNPILERVKFLSIFASNLDEFFMVRVSGLRGQMSTGVVAFPPDGMSPSEQLSAIRDRLLPDLAASEECWEEQLTPILGAVGIRILRYSELKGKQRKLLRRQFKREIFPVLTPLAFDPGHPFPHISNLSINLAVVVRDPQHGERFARLKVPQAFPRLMRLPDEEEAARLEALGLEDTGSGANFVLIEEVIAANLDRLFPGYEVVAAHPFRVTRDADYELEGDEAADLLTSMAEVVGRRYFGSAIRLEIDEGMPDRIRDILIDNLRLAPYQIYSVGMIGAVALAQLHALDRSELKDPPFLPWTVPSQSGENYFEWIRERDRALYHPYDSFTTVVDFVRQAASDPDVVAIKQTLYRTGPASPIVQALMEARENGKQVAVLVELKARFDEESNIGWARALEDAGVHVVYGLVGLKTHAKACLVVRRERNGVSRFAHLSTGNYNASTARFYTDLGFFTCNEEITEDLADLFNSLTGYSLKSDYRKLIVAPGQMRSQIVQRIRREVARHRAEGDGHLVFKCNALVDKACIQELYRASQAGVKIQLQVRGVCCLRPGVAGLSESIEVTSIVGRFLEHTRMYWFRNGGEGELLAGSADLMPRNLDGRVELLFPIEDPVLLRSVRDDILFAHLSDDAKCRRLRSDGTYARVEPQGELFDSQLRLIEQGGSWRLGD